VKCPREKCGSTNVQHLPHWLDTLPPDSPHRKTYEQPADAGVQVAGVLFVALVGVVMLSSGHWVGLLALLGAAAWAVVGFRRAGVAEVDRARWSKSLICHVCTRTFVT
jgi:hypothetical protein